MFSSISISGKTIRIYRTGDRARYWHDGTIEYLGRKDSQIKINGVRIELSEIENEIDKIQNVQKSVVLFRPIDDSGSEKQLIAFIEGIFSDDDISNIKGKLTKALPGYMIPAIFKPVEEFSLLSSGKIDKKKLSKLPIILNPVNENSDSSTASVIRSLWSRLLNIEFVDSEKNFFDLGGHSMLIIKMKDEIYKLFNLTIELPVLFQNTTLKRLADYIDELNSSGTVQNDNLSRKKQNFGRLKPRNRK